MKYFFIPGRSRALSKLELIKVLEVFEVDKYNLAEYTEFFTLDTKSDQLVIEKVFNRLGGCISYGLLYEDIDNVLTEVTTKDKKKITFGVSIYTDSPRNYTSRSIKDVLEDMKKYFKELKISSRYLIPQGLRLDSGQILRSKMLFEGFELVILEDKKSKVGKQYGKTLGVQDIDLYSMIEYDKPYTNKEMGVLPAKLAKILINLAQVKEGTIWDPFCGSGTILLMSLLSGLDALGSDIDPEAVKGSKENIEWLSQKGVIGDVRYEVTELDVLNPDWRKKMLLKKTSIEAIVCEPFMGPPQFKLLSAGKANTFLHDVETLYKGLFDIIDETKKKASTVVLVVPSYKTYNGWITVSLNSIVGKRWEIEKIAGEDLQWSRSNSIIKRNIFILKRKNI